MIPAGSVRTVTGDVPASALGTTYMHEHLIIDSPTVADRFPHIHLPSADDAIAELGRCADVAVGTVVDAMPLGSGRGPERLARISEASGVKVVMATGLHTDKYYDEVPDVRDASDEQLLEWFIADIEDGADRNDHLGGEKVDRIQVRAGIIKVATSHIGVDRRAEKLFGAAVEAAKATGAPILTHCEEGTGGDDQVTMLSELGLPLDRVVLSHTDKVEDPDYHTDLLESGVYLEFDQALRQEEAAVGRTARLLATQIERGFAGQLMLGTDGARRSLWSTFGGQPGLAWLATGYRGILESVGINREVQHQLFVENPARFLAGRITASESHTHTTSPTQRR